MKEKFSSLLKKMSLNNLKITGVGGITLISTLSLLSIQIPPGQTLQVAIVAFLGSFGLNIAASQAEKWLETLANTPTSGEQAHVEALASIMAKDIRKNPQLSIELGKFVDHTRSYDIALKVLEGDSTALGWLAEQTYLEVRNIGNTSNEILSITKKIEQKLDNKNIDQKTVIELLRQLLSNVQILDSNKEIPWHHFPYSKSNFVGRQIEVEQLSNKVEAGKIVSIWGMGGTGKTELVKKITEELASKFEGAVLWATLTDEVNVGVDERLFSIWDDWVSVHPTTLINDLTKPKIQTLLSNTSGDVLIVLDDVWRDTETLFRGILKVVEKYKVAVIFTTRQKDLAVQYSDYVYNELDDLSDREIIQWFHLIFDTSEVENHKEEILSVANILEHHLLAINLVISWLRKRGLQYITRLIERLVRHKETDNPFKELNLGDAKDRNLELALATSLDVLAQEKTNQEVHRKFSYLGVFPRNTRFSEEMILEIWGEDSGSIDTRELAEDLIAQFVDDALIRQHSYKRYEIHTTMHEYSRALLKRNYETEIPIISQRYLDSIFQHILYYFSLDDLEKWRHINQDFNHITFWAGSLEKLIREWLESQNAPSIDNSIIDIFEFSFNDPVDDYLVILATWENFVINMLDYLQRYHLGDIGKKWLILGFISAYSLKSEHLGRIGAFLVNWYLEAGNPGDAEQFFNHLSSKNQIFDNLNMVDSKLKLAFGHTSEALSNYKRLLEEEVTADDSIKIHLYNAIGYSELILGNLVVAKESFELALDLCNAEQDLDAKAIVLKHLGMTMAHSFNFEKAQDYLEESLSIRRERLDRIGEATTLGTLAELYYLQGKFEHSLEILNKVLEIETEMELEYRVSTTLGNIGTTLMLMGDSYLLEGVSKLEESIELARQVGDSRGVAQKLVRLGQHNYSQSDSMEGKKHLIEAVEIYENLGEKWRTAVTWQELGKLLEKSNLTEAIGYYEKSLIPLREHKSQTGYGDTLNHLSKLHAKTGNYENTLKYLQEAVELFNVIGKHEHLVGTLLWQIEYAQTIRDVQLLDSALGMMEINLKYLSTEQELSLNMGICYAIISDNMSLLTGDVANIEKIISQWSATSRSIIEKEIAARVQPFLARSIILGREYLNHEILYSALILQGQIYTELHNYRDSKEIFVEAANLVNIDPKLKDQIYVVQYEIGVTCRRQNNPEEAVSWYRKALKNAKQHATPIMIARINSAMGIAYYYVAEKSSFNKKDLKSSRRYHNRALKLFEQHGQIDQVAMEYYNLHMTYHSCACIEYIDLAIATWKQVPLEQRPAHYQRALIERPQIIENYNCT